VKLAPHTFLVERHPTINALQRKGFPSDARAHKVTSLVQEPLMTSASPGDTVSIHFTAFLSDGTEIDTTAGSPPHTFVVGSGAVLPGLDEAVQGMKQGSSKIALLKPVDAFGERLEELVRPAPLSLFGDGLEIVPGKRIGANTPDGEVIEMNVIAVEGDQVILDANHPFAGLEITFRIEMVSIKKRR
jgi:peptidylprolyl isomerase